MFNLIVLTADIFLNTYGDPFSVTLLLMAPLIIVFFVSPMVVLIEIKQKSFNIRMLRFLEKLGLNRKIEVTIDQKPLEEVR